MSNVAVQPATISLWVLSFQSLEKELAVEIPGEIPTPNSAELRNSLTSALTTLGPVPPVPKCKDAIGDRPNHSNLSMVRILEILCQISFK